MGQVIRVGMVGDRMLVEGFKAWARQASDLRFVAEGRTVAEVLPGARQADVVVLDLVLCDRSAPGPNVRLLVEAGHRVLAVAAAPEPSRIAAAMLAGARGFVGKDQDLAELATAIRAVAMGGVSFAHQVADPGAYPPRPRLSAREQAVLVAYCSGMTLKAAAHHIGISTATAKTYLERVKAKYEQVGRPAYTKLELAARVMEES